VGGFLIDTGVVSEFITPEPSLQVKLWFESAAPESLLSQQSEKFLLVQSENY
jgi:hypothetical protein